MATGDEIVGWIKEIRDRGLVRRTVCPECDWTLTEHPVTGQLHCVFCGWTDGLRIKRKVL